MAETDQSFVATIGNDIERAASLLRQGEVVAIPTETVYGLAGNALNTAAVARIFEVKDRPTFDPLIIHTDSWEKVLRFVRDVPQPARELATAFWPGPLTLLLPKQESISDLVTAGLDTVAIRIPQHPLTLTLLANLDFPLAAPSANPFGYISPTSAEHVQKQLGRKIPYILDGGPCQVGIESTIVGFEDDQAVIYRLGGARVEDVERITGKAKVMLHSSSNPQAPGMLKSHYAPSKPVFVSSLSEVLALYAPEEIGILSFERLYSAIPVENQIVLSTRGNFLEAAQGLFAALRKLDALPVKAIFAELFPEKDLGRAINDRLRRAAAK